MPQKRKNKAVFVDRDGTLNAMVYNDTHGIFDSPRNIREVRLKPHAAHLVKAAKKAGFLVIVVTNQPGIAKGTLTPKRLNAINRRLSALLAEQGAQWDALYYCPHHPGPGMRKSPFARKCQCRKPRPGLILQAARKHAIDLPSSWMVGDGLNDVQAGNAAGCRSILVANLKIEQVEQFFNLAGCRPCAVARDLERAAHIILKAKTGRKK